MLNNARQRYAKLTTTAAAAAPAKGVEGQENRSCGGAWPLGGTDDSPSQMPLSIVNLVKPHLHFLLRRLHSPPFS